MTQTADMNFNSTAVPPKLGRKQPRTSLFPWKRWDIILGSMSLNLFSLVIPILVLQMYDRIIPNKSYNTLILMSCGVILASVLEATLRFSHSRILSWLGMHFENIATVGAFDHLTKATPESFRKRGVGEHVENIESIPILREFLAGQGFLVFLDFPFLLLYIGVIAYFSWTIALVPIFFLSLFVLISLVLAQKLKKALEEQLDLDDRRYNFIIETLTNHHTLKSMGMEELLLRRYERIHAQCSGVTYKINHYSAEFRDLANLCSYLMFGGVVGVAALEVIHGNATIGIMGASIILSNRAMQPVQAAVGMLTRLQHFSIAKHRLKEIFKMPMESLAYKGVSKMIQGHLKIENLSFHYTPQNTESSPFILQSLDLEVEPGQVVAIYGQNGSGKSTLMQLIAGILTPSAGTIFVDDMPMAEYNSTTLRKQIMYVPPRGKLFQGTILENITLFQVAELADEAFSLSRQLGLSEWIARLPQGYETKVGDSLFHTLPEGIHQRICLVRALMTHPKILILDEANTALDEKGDYALRTVINKLRGDTTILFVTHRPSISEIADVTYELVEGKLVSRSSDVKLEHLEKRPSTAFSFNISLNDQS